MTKEREDVFEGIVKTLMLFLSEQPLMSFTFKRRTFQEFPFDDFTLSSIHDAETDEQTFMLVRSGPVH